MKSLWSSQSGYTLLELLLVLSILGVMFSLLMPAVNKLYLRLELDVASRSLLADLRDSQRSAWVHGDEHEVRFTRFTPRYTLWESGVFRGQKHLPERVNYRLGYIESSVSTLLFGPTRTGGSGGIRLINGAGQQTEVKIYPITGHIVYEGITP
ncbi:hypothetical protein CIG75_08180 [Tumebacillus algifaecis]|uniref:Prepilin-type N-terminal cleavage/methylation domain-containing protein n=1 Tax=Tumebacillus algifaecis TaxID=1214604 RepID=A0A223D0G9_9BACL|nr:prepilin-type N-terminal cleavage/methylation domain-containing protein [Tumebacillus algifaecis]ASS74965.1 hypothetical protein CIG75_08180 [Tumebacillus algifaecis]